MKPVYKLLLSSGLLLACCLVGTQMLANNDEREFTKTINKQYNITADGTVDLNNKYGKIDVKTWDNNAVRISVRIVVEARSESDAQEVFDRIDIDFYESGNTVGATTNIESTNNSWWNWGNNKDDFSINYEIMMPSTGNLKVQAKYCDVFSAAISGEGDLTVKYGNIQAEGFGEDSEVDLAYGNGNISRVRDLNLELAYGNLDLGEASDISAEVRYGNLNAENAGDILLDSRYSNFKLGDIRELRNDGKYDNIEIKSVEELVCETHYSSLKIGSLARRGNLDMAYGSAKLYQIETSINEVLMNGRYTDFKVYMEPGVSCSLDLTGRYADIRLPSSGVDTTYDVKEGSNHEVRGRMGSGGDAIIKAEMSYGGILVSRN